MRPDNTWSDRESLALAPSFVQMTKFANISSYSRYSRNPTPPRAGVRCHLPRRASRVNFVDGFLRFILLARMEPPQRRRRNQKKGRNLAPDFGSRERGDWQQKRNRSRGLGVGAGRLGNSCTGAVLGT